MNDNVTSQVNCFAYTCPAMGTMTRDAGSGKWLCGFHFGAEVEQWGQISQELLRLKWLVDITRNIRGNAMDPHAWPAMESNLNKELVLAQRKDLRRGNQEPINRWLRRLESVLRDSCSSAGRQPPLQEDGK